MDAEAPRQFSFSGLAKVAITTIVSAAITISVGYATFRVTAREPRLAFELSEGPPLSTVGLTRRIYVLQVRNTGSREVEEFVVSLSLPGGKLEDVSVSRTAGLDLTERRDSAGFRATAAFFNPSDSLAVSLLASSASTEPLQIVVRGRGVVGQAKPGRSATAESDVLLSLATSALAGVALLLGVSTILLRQRPPFVARFLKRMDTDEDRRVVMMYILGSAGLHELAASVRASGDLTMYRELADSLLFLAIEHDDKRAAAIKSLIAMLVIPQMHPSSREVVLRHLRNLQVNATALATEEVRRGATVSQLRDRIDEIFAQPSE
jgi:hypothetical protein